MAKNIRWHSRHRFLWRKLRMNRRYKDRLFRFLFQNKADQLNLYERQSTCSPNMPLRGFLYLARQYEELTAGQRDDIYSSRLVKLPTPEYLVFYNGRKEEADRKVQFLSDSFGAGRGSGCLECKAVMLNINRGHNRELMGKCRRLWEYSEFVAEVNENLDRKMSLKSAIMAAIDRCIEQGILEDVLRKNQSEVLHMILTEYDERRHLKNTYEEGKQAGYNEGRQAGYSEGRQAGYSEGRDGLLEDIIQKKLKRGKGAAAIAEELEMEVSVIEERIGKRKPHS